jgi:DHA2 family multidrug resistance protein-like MFS transporter
MLNTSRQVGTALGVAVLGSIGATVARADWGSWTRGLPVSLQSQANALQPLVVLGRGSQVQVLASGAVGPAGGALAAQQAVSAFTDGMAQAFVVGAAVALVAGALALVGLASRRQPAAGPAGGLEDVADPR